MNDSLSSSDAAQEPDVAVKGAPSRRSLLPFFLANLMAVYMPGLLPLFMPAREPLADGGGDALRIRVIEFLHAPFAAMSLFIDGGIMMLTEQLGEVGSFYLFFFGLWFVVLGITLLFRNEKRRLWVPFFLFVVFTAQSLFFTRQAMIDGEALEGRPVEEADDEPKMPSSRPIELPQQ